MSHTVTVNTKTFRFSRSTSGTTAVFNGSYLASASGVVQLSETVLGIVCVGLIAFYGDKYYYDFGAQAKEWISLLFKMEQLDVWKPVVFFMLVATTCLINTSCLLISCIVSYNTASMIAKTIYGMLYHIVAFLLYLSASIALIVSLNKKDIKGYRNGYYYDPFLATGIIGTIISAFYLLSSILSYRSYRGTV